MSQNRTLNFLIEKLYSSRNNLNIQHSLVRDLTNMIRYATKTNLQHILELLNITQDIELIVKIFSILAAYIVSSDTNIDIIITCNTVYNKIHNVLNGALPRKTITALNFIMSLVHVNDEESVSKRKSLALYARNMIRVSGCLSTMAHLFTDCMIPQDTWLALCRCLAEICRFSEVNQNYCSYLVPVCVQKCIQGDVEMFSVLKSMLHNHRRNIQLFIECNGIVVFTREFLQYDTCIELLNALVQHSSSVSLLVKTTDISVHLHNILQLYGSQSQIGQWATVVLYHINSEPKDLGEENVTKSCTLSKELQEANVSSFDNNSLNINGNEKDDTQDLVEKNNRKIFYWETKNVGLATISDNNMRKNNTYTEKSYTCEKSNTASMLTDNYDLPNMNNFESNLSASLSFSFLLELNKSIKPKPNNSQFIVNKINRSTQTYTGYSTTVYNTDANQKKDECKMMSTTEESHNKLDRECLKNFTPKFASTPKHSILRRRNKIPHSCISGMRRYTNRDTNKKSINRIYNNTYCKEQNASSCEKQQSISTRFLKVINDSCTTLVKTVTSIFKKKNDNNSTKKENVTSIPAQACSFSFTNYMKERDAIFRNQCFQQKSIGLEIEKSNTDVNSCKTCNDTILLKDKLTKDKYLKQTVKRLKLGINLYGCDFKKISKTLWPQDNYMTPDILYLLYRKLIIK